MPELPRRAFASSWRILAFLGTTALVLAAVVAATGGVDWRLGPLYVRVQTPWRLLAAGVGLTGAALWLGGARARAALARAWDARDRHARRVAAAAAVTVAIVGIVKGTNVAGGADAYGYVSQALLWLKGLPLQTEPLASAVTWSDPEWTFSPLGYRPGVKDGLIVPTYPPGLPLAMAVVAGLIGSEAVYILVPALGAVAVWMTFLLGRRVSDPATGASAAVLLASSPIFLYQLVQPMSDVPVTAWWLIALWGAAEGRRFTAGAGAAAAVLTRPNLAPVVLPVLAAVLWHAHARHRTTGAALRSVALFALPLALAAAFLGWLNLRLYGSPFAWGYGAPSELFALGNVAVNARRYTGWLLETQTPLLLLALAAPLAARFARGRATGIPPEAHAWLGLAFAAVVAACYLPYAPFEEWWYLRFLLPAIPVLLLLSTALCVGLASTAPPAARAPLVAGVVALLAVHYAASAADRRAFELRRLESRYLEAGKFAAQQLPSSAVLLSVQESGPLRMYGGRTTLRFDHLQPDQLDAAVAFLDRTGNRPYFVLEAWEEAQFRDRFSRSSVLGLLDWPPMAEIRLAVKVRFYDPRDRERFMAGEHIETVIIQPKQPDQP
jgi:hypothetical protein